MEIELKRKKQKKYTKEPHLLASITVEATILLPLFIFFFLHIASTIEMIHLHGMIQFSLWNTGKKLQVYSIAEESEKGIQVPDWAISYLWVRSELENTIGKSRLEGSPMEEGLLGFQLFQSEYGNEDRIQVIATYRVRPKLTIFPFPYRRMVNQYECRAFTGYEVTEKEINYVYVTEYGTVWHSSRQCSYLAPSIRGVSTGEIGILRNNSGEIYRPCEFCGNTKCSNVFITDYGNRYHSDFSCRTLNRKVRAIPEEEKGKYAPCHKCAG